MSHPLDFDPIVEARRQWSAHGWQDSSDGMAAITSIVRAQQIFLARIDAVLRPSTGSLHLGHHCVPTFAKRSRRK